MDAKQRVKKQKRRNLLVLIIIFVLAAGGATGYYFWNQKTTIAAAQSSTTDLKTAQVRQGDLTISASGTGTLVAGQTANLSFPVAGTLDSVNVKVGDKVESGQVLAVLQDLGSLQAKVNTAQLDLISAQKTLDDLQSNAGEALGQAQLDLANAQKAYDDAKSALKTGSMLRCDQDTTDAYYNQYLLLAKKYDQMKANGWNDQQYLTMVKPVIDARDAAYANYTYCAGFTAYEISSSQATLVKTEAALKAAQDNLNLIAANNGVDPDQLAVDQNNVATAKLALEQAQKNLDGATMKAPFAGTVISVGGAAGDAAGTGTFITLADLDHPNIQFNVDETDMDKVALGYPVQVSFDALPNQTFTGKVTEITPQLTTLGNTQTLQGLASLDLGSEAGKVNLPLGLNASVEVVAGEAKNALLVPVEALKDLGGGEYAVFIVGSDGQPRLTVVKVGLMDLTYAQITQGVKLGDTVTTGIVETK